MPDPSAPGALARWAGRAGIALVALSLAGLSALWAWDRSRHWEVPGFAAERFVALTPAREAGGAGRWLVVVNPACERCRRTYPASVLRHAREAPGDPLDVLFVDVASRPGAAALAAFPSDAAWWDSAGVWRRAWGHRVYGEVLRFHPDGTLIATDPPPREE